jgi:hypothetical protein
VDAATSRRASAGLLVPKNSFAGSMASACPSVYRAGFWSEGSQRVSSCTLASS